MSRSASDFDSRFDNEMHTVRAKAASKRIKHVCRACVHCKRAHLACDESRPCKRCVHLGRTDCVDVEHKRRGRPKVLPEEDGPVQEEVDDAPERVQTDGQICN